MKLELNNNKIDKQYNKNKHDVLAEYQKLKKDYEILKKTNIDNLNGHIEIFENLNNNYKEMQDEIDNYKKIIDQKDFEYTNLYSLYNQLDPYYYSRPEAGPYYGSMYINLNLQDQIYHIWKYRK